jgi:hypothetical protein
LHPPQAVRASVRFGFAVVLGASLDVTVRRRPKSRLCNIDHTILPRRLKQVTDRIEKKLEELPNLDYLKSYTPGEPVVFVNLKDSTRASDVSDLWYRVRKKVGDIKQTLSEGVQGLSSMTNSATLVYFLAQNSTALAFGENHPVGGKLQDRTELNLTPAAAVDSFLCTAARF